MIRTLLWLVAGVVLGGIIHIIVILTLPALAEENVWTRVAALNATNRDGIGQTLQMGIFNAAQTRLLAQQQLDVAEGLLVVESSSNDLLILVRLAPPHHAMRERFEQELSEVTCGPRS